MYEACKGFFTDGAVHVSQVDTKYKVNLVDWSISHHSHTLTQTINLNNNIIRKIVSFNFEHLFICILRDTVTNLKLISIKSWICKSAKQSNTVRKVYNHIYFSFVLQCNFPYWLCFFQ